MDASILTDDSLTDAMLHGPPAAPAPPAAAAAPYRHREMKIVTVPMGGWGMAVDGELVGVAESTDRLLYLVASWTRG